MGFADHFGNNVPVPKVKREKVLLRYASYGVSSHFPSCGSHLAPLSQVFRHPALCGPPRPPAIFPLHLLDSPDGLPSLSALSLEWSFFAYSPHVQHDMRGDGMCVDSVRIVAVGLRRRGSYRTFSVRCSWEAILDIATYVSLNTLLGVLNYSQWRHTARIRYVYPGEGDVSV